MSRFAKISEFEAVQTFARFVDPDNCKMGVFTRKNRLRYSRERALQSLVQGPYIVYLACIPYLQPGMTNLVDLRSIEFSFFNWNGVLKHSNADGCSLAKRARSRSVDPTE